jgi:hypothetical protein
LGGYHNRNIGCGSRIKIDECAPSGNYRPLTDDPAVTLIAIAD